MALKYADALSITVVRPCIVFGAGDRGLVEVFRPIARLGTHVVVGSDDRHVSLVAVADLVECLLLAAEHGERLVPGAPGYGIYFAAAEDISYVELGMLIARALGKPQPRILSSAGMVDADDWPVRRCHVAESANVRDGSAAIRLRDVLAGSWTCSSAKARQQLGWSPAALLADRLRETAQWYRDAHWLE